MVCHYRPHGILVLCRNLHPDEGRYQAYNYAEVLLTHGSHHHSHGAGDPDHGAGDPDHDAGVGDHTDFVDTEKMEENGHVEKDILEETVEKV